MGHPMVAIVQINSQLPQFQCSTRASVCESPHAGKLRPGETPGACRASCRAVFQCETNLQRVAGYDQDSQVGTGRKAYEKVQLINSVEALELLVHRESKVDNSVFYDVLKRCTAQKDLVLGSRVHVLAVKSGFESNAFVANHIICMYASHGRLKEAMRVFTKVAKPDRYMWTSIILAHARCGQPADAISLYRRLRQSNLKPNNHVFVAALKSCAAAQDLASGRQVHDDILGAASEPDIFVYNCLVHMYAKCGGLEDARRVFDNLPRKNVVTWTAMIDGYAQHGHGEEALSLYASMQQEGISPANRVTFLCILQACANVKALHQGKLVHAQIQERGLEADVAVGNCVVNMYAKCGSIKDARRVFDSLPSKDLVTWSAMIAGYAQHGLGQEALSLYAIMQQECITPADAVAFVSLLQACGIVAGLEKGKEIHAQISEAGYEATDLFVANALIDMYGKCGSMVDAQQVFDSLPIRDIVTWNALLAGYARQGGSELVFNLFHRMGQDGIQPDGITFLSVLTVCCHEGLIGKAQRYFECMCKEYDIPPTIEHCTCLVDLLGRAGQVDIAMDLVKTMPFQADAAVWSSLLCASQKWSNVEIGRHAFDCAVRANGNDAAIYVSMSNIYAGARMYKDSEAIEAMRVKRQAWKQPGQSWWTDISGCVHSFMVGDMEHPEWQDIDVKLEDLFVRMNGEEW